MRGIRSDTATFTVWTLADFVGALTAVCNADWASELRERYLEPLEAIKPGAPPRP